MCDELNRKSNDADARMHDAMSRSLEMEKNSVNLQEQIKALKLDADRQLQVGVYLLQVGVYLLQVGIYLQRVGV